MVGRALQPREVEPVDVGLHRPHGPVAGVRAVAAEPTPVVRVDGESHPLGADELATVFDDLAGRLVLRQTAQIDWEFHGTSVEIQQ